MLFLSSAHFFPHFFFIFSILLYYYSLFFYPRIPFIGSCHVSFYSYIHRSNFMLLFCNQNEIEWKNEKNDGILRRINARMQCIWNSTNRRLNLYEIIRIKMLTDSEDKKEEMLQKYLELTNWWTNDPPKGKKEENNRFENFHKKFCIRCFRKMF